MVNDGVVKRGSENGKSPSLVISLPGYSGKFPKLPVSVYNTSLQCGER